jgi:hypothetical protein
MRGEVLFSLEDFAAAGACARWFSVGVACVYLIVSKDRRC